MNQPENAVILAVGPEGVDAALTFALDTARRGNHPVHLVHVLQLPPGDAYVGVYGGALEAASGLLESELARARSQADGAVPVTGEVVDHGFVVDQLVAQSRTARLVVLQHRDLNRVHRLVTGSVANGVAARADSPVVSVPENWAPATGEARVVTVAVQDPDGAAGQLRTAFEEARVRSLPLVVLHAWWLGTGYDGLSVDSEFREGWESRSRAELEPVLAPLRESYPGVDVSVVVRHARPADAVLDASENSEIVVIARRHHLLPLGTHLGPVARAVLNRSACPVLVTPEATVAETRSAEQLASLGSQA
jgi:nucleotide-binding universal stress UspA family protein